MRIDVVMPAVCLVWLGCRSAIEPATIGRLAVSVDTVVASVSQWGAKIDVPATLRNDGTVDVHISPCSPSLEREQGAAWTMVWSVICTASERGNVKIGPGEQYGLQVAALARSGSAWTPEVVPGRYRLPLTVVVGHQAKASYVASPPFSVRFQ